MPIKRWLALFLPKRFWNWMLRWRNWEPISISYCNSERNASIVQAIQKQVEEALHIHLELDALEPKVFFEKLSKKEFQLAAGSWIADFNDPVNFLRSLNTKMQGQTTPIGKTENTLIF